MHVHISDLENSVHYSDNKPLQKNSLSENPDNAIVEADFITKTNNDSMKWKPYIPS